MPTPNENAGTEQLADRFLRASEGRLAEAMQAVSEACVYQASTAGLLTEIVENVIEAEGGGNGGRAQAARSNGFTVGFAPDGAPTVTVPRVNMAMALDAAVQGRTQALHALESLRGITQEAGLLFNAAWQRRVTAVLGSQSAQQEGGELSHRGAPPTLTPFQRKARALKELVQVLTYEDSDVAGVLTHILELANMTEEQFRTTTQDNRVDDPELLYVQQLIRTIITGNSED